MSLLSPSLLAFEAVVQKGTVLEAAKLVGLTQTGVTQRIRSLEKQLGTTLFTRSRKGMRLTQEGTDLLAYVQAARSLEGDTLLKLSGKDTEKIYELKIGGTALALKTYFFANASKLKFEKEKVRFSITQASAPQLLELLKNSNQKSNLDFALLPSPYVGAEFKSLKLAPEDYVFIIGAQHKALETQKVLESFDSVDCLEEDYPCQRALGKIRGLKNTLGLQHLTSNFEQSLELINSLRGFTVAPASLAQRLAKQGRARVLKGKAPLRTDLHLVWYDRKSLPKPMKALIAAFKS